MLTERLALTAPQQPQDGSGAPDPSEPPTEPSPPSEPFSWASPPHPTVRAQAPWLLGLLALVGVVALLGWPA